MHSVTSRPEDAQPTELTPAQPRSAAPFPVSPERQHMMQPGLAPAPLAAPRTRRRNGRYKRRSRGKLLRKNVVRFIIAFALALVILVFWRGVAHSQERSATFGWKSPESHRARPETRQELIARILQTRQGDTATATGAAVATGVAVSQQQEQAASTTTPTQSTPKSTMAQDAITITEWIRNLSAGASVKSTGKSKRTANGQSTEPPQRTASQDSSQPAAPAAQPQPAAAQVQRDPRPQGASPQATPPQPRQLPLAPPGLRGDSRQPGSARQPAPPVPAQGAPGRRTAGKSAADIKPLAEIRDEELTFRSSLDLSLALERQFHEIGESPVTDLAVLRSQLTHHLIDLSIRAGQTDNPRDNLEAVRAYIGSVLRVEAVQRSKPDLDLLLTGRELAGHRASQAGWCLLALIFSERINSYLDLEPVITGELMALRYRSGQHRYLLVPLYPDRLYTDRDFVALAHADDDGEHPIRVLTRREFWGVIFSEAGSALLDVDGQVAQAAYWTDRGLSLYPEHAMGHVARARIQWQRNEKESAKESLDTAVRLEPTNITARMQRAELLQGSMHVPTLIEDLRWLSRQGKHPRASFRLARLFVDQGEFLAAAQEVQFLKNTEAQMPAALQAEFPGLRNEIEAAPWVAVLTGKHQDAQQPDARRFQAIEQLRAYPLPTVHDALIAAMDDTNLRLSSYAWQVLKDMTGRSDLPKVPERWKTALGRP